MPILTAKVGTNADLFPDILELYVPEGSEVLDLTYGRGIFWKYVDRDKYKLITNDLNQEIKVDRHDDFRDTVWNNEQFDAVVFDPPYLYVGGFRTFKASVDKLYNNKQRAIEQGIRGVDAVDQMYKDGMTEGWRVLRNKGIMICKCMDQVMSQRLQMPHIRYIKHWEEIGGYVEDFFVLVIKGQPTMRHKYQLHARRNHSYFIVLRKRE